MLELREYQQRSLAALEGYLQVCTTHGAKAAFVIQTERPYRAVPQLPALPYVCLRVPTGGGKTLLACHALGKAATNYLQAERAVCLWLAPSNAIRLQTLTALQDRNHPYRQAVAQQFSGQVTVLDLAEALYVRRSTLAGETTIIVSTLQALRRDDTEGLKVYESAGALQHHFTGLSAELESQLERREDGTIPYSLCNALRLWRPVVLMDEAHNARTQLSFDTLARFNPSCIIEFTATPELMHRPEQGRFASNVLHHVSAAELKAEEMVKLPIKLQTRADWKEVVSEAIGTQRELERVAIEEERQTGEYIRPIVLLQAQARSQTRATLTVETVKQTLMEEFRIPEEQIAVATGQTRELDGVPVFDRSCPIRFIITVQALKEGWDCSFAYVLCSVAELGSATAVEQLLGRILRLPRARRKHHAALNCAYAFAASARFIEAAQSLKDALVESGFERIEVEELVRPVETQTTFDQAHPLFVQSAAVVAEVPNLAVLPSELRERVSFDDQTRAFTVSGRISDAERASLEACFVTPEGRRAVERVYHESHGRTVVAGEPSAAASFRVPALAVRVDGQLELFEETHFLDFAWRLSEQAANLSESDFPSQYVAGQTGELDVSEQGRVEIRFVEQAQRQLQLMGVEPGWDIAGLTNWLDRQIPHPDVTRSESTLFLHRVLSELIESRRVTIEQLAQQKFRLRKAIAEKIDEHRQAAKANAYHRMLFSVDAAEIEVGPEICFEITEENYSPNWYYEGGYQFRKPLFHLIGELKSEGEEFECAAFLDQLDGVQTWVRNLDRRPESSFWLQTSTDKFYPDFVALLNDGRYLVVESKGEDRWSNDDSREKRAVGELWESRSNGKCLFIMPNGPDWQAIAEKIRRPSVYPGGSGPGASVC
ncbi:MAG: restriction endonuclease subunit R [Planctomycetota bacterium]|nr:MAG: restriction endonuclease subunit R [Planctomycetota bacterium]